MMDLTHSFILGVEIRGLWGNWEVFLLRNWGPRIDGVVIVGEYTTYPIDEPGLDELAAFSVHLFSDGLILIDLVSYLCSLYF